MTHNQIIKEELTKARDSAAQTVEDLRAALGKCGDKRPLLAKVLLEEIETAANVHARVDRLLEVCSVEVEL